VDRLIFVSLRENILSLRLYSRLFDLGRFFSFLILYTVCRTPWTGDQHVARLLPSHRTTQTQNKHTHISMPWVGFELTIPVLEQTKTVRALGRPHTNCVKTSIKTWDKRNKSWRRHHDSDWCAAVFIISFVSTVRHVAGIVSWLLHVLTHAGVRPTLDLTATLIGKNKHGEENYEE
jgi:hypothetical protein